MTWDRRDYQDAAVKASRSALKKQDNTLAVLPTGTGKAACEGFFIEDEVAKNPDARFLCIQPTEELLNQNLATVKSITGLSCSIVKAEQNDWSGQCIFASPQTVGRADRVQDIPADITHVCADEIHALITGTFDNALGTLSGKRGRFKLFTMTATPVPGIRKYVDNVAYRMTTGEAIKRGILVPPKCYTIELGLPLDDLPRRGDDADMAAAAELLDKKPVNSRVVDEWEKRALGRPTVAYASLVEHAKSLAKEWSDRGYPFGVVYGSQPKGERRDTIAAYKGGELLGVVNALALIAGFDHQPTSCVVIDRPMYGLHTMQQAIGRGLRKVDPERFPGVRKLDCVVLDFCGALARHGTLEFEVDLDEPYKAGEKIKAYKQCPSCYGYVPSAARCCDLCGHIWHVAVDENGRNKIITDFTMTEIDILNASPFKYVSLTDDDTALLATAFTAWAGVFFDGVNWHAVGRQKDHRVRHIGIGTRIQAVATADDFLRQHGDRKAARKNKRWLTEDASDAQKQLLRSKGYCVGPLDFSYTKYRASCLLDFQFAKREIIRMVYGG